MIRPTRMLLLRHGAVASPWPGRLYGQLDVPLSEEGRGEARRVARALADVHLDAVISSGLERAEFTAALLRAPRGLARRDDPRLRELDRGSWAGLGREELARRWSDPDQQELCRRGAFQAPDGERPAALVERVSRALDGAARDYPGGCVAVVAHAWVLRAAVARVIGLAPERLLVLHVPTSGLVLLDWIAGMRGGGRLVALAPDRLPAPPSQPPA